MTSIAKSRLEEGDYFQITRFKFKSSISYYELGIFIELYFNALVLILEMIFLKDLLKWCHFMTT
ncbi:hypothetical protein BKK54_11165 [Rodentibacter genomosp. 1]|uniref:Uncharacterized protein n=1 Tax=Rodentibacter genomosp. 1 TaxID=1908264 RepID=A0A1V3J0F0_9PAST|nr:hypothetical protein BKK54_11165 [Rodentibacter genomosp. 1]